MFNLKSGIFILNYMDIKEFYRSNQQNHDQNQNNLNQNTNDKTHPNKTSNQDFSGYQDTIDKYKNLSQQELYKELFTQASELKSQGKLDPSMLNTLSATLAPMLNPEQEELLNSLIDRLK